MELLNNGPGNMLVFEQQPVQIYRYRYENEIKKRIRGGGLKSRNGTTPSDVPVVRLKCGRFVDQVKFKCILYTPDRKHQHCYRLHDGSTSPCSSSVMEFDGLRYPEENCWRCQLRNLHIVTYGKKDFYKWFNSNYLSCNERQFTKINKFRYAELKKLQTITEVTACLRVQAFCGPSTLLGTTFSELIFNQRESKKFKIINIVREFQYCIVEPSVTAKVPNRNKKRKRLNVQSSTNEKSFRINGHDGNSVSSVYQSATLITEEQNALDASKISTSQPRKQSSYAMWTEERVRHLIRLYEAHPILWNNQLDAVYGAQDLRDKAFSHIAHTLHVEPQHIKKKINSLRNHFCREYQMLRSANDMESSRSKWRFFDYLAFLKDCIPPLDAKPNLFRDHVSAACTQWQMDEVSNETQEVPESPWPAINDDSITIEYSSDLSLPEVYLEDPSCIVDEINDMQIAVKRYEDDRSDNDIGERNLTTSPNFQHSKGCLQRTSEMQFFCDYLRTQLMSIEKASTRRRVERDILGIVHKALDDEHRILEVDKE